MKKRLILLAVIISFLAGCCTGYRPNNPNFSFQEKPNVRMIMDNTVALVAKHPLTGQVYKFCSGSFISNFEILTANHCVIDDPNSDKNPVGQFIMFQN